MKDEQEGSDRGLVQRSDIGENRLSFPRMNTSVIRSLDLTTKELLKLLFTKTLVLKDKKKYLSASDDRLLLKTVSNHIFVAEEPVDEVVEAMKELRLAFHLAVYELNTPADGVSWPSSQSIFDVVNVTMQTAGEMAGGLTSAIQKAQSLKKVLKKDKRLAAHLEAANIDWDQILEKLGTAKASADKLQKAMDPWVKLRRLRSLRCVPIHLPGNGKQQPLIENFEVPSDRDSTVRAANVRDAEHAAMSQVPSFSEPPNPIVVQPVTTLQQGQGENVGGQRLPVESGNPKKRTRSSGSRSDSVTAHGFSSARTCERYGLRPRSRLE